MVNHVWDWPKQGASPNFVEMNDHLGFFPELQPYARGRLKVSDLHEIYFEECGNPAGKPVVILHVVFRLTCGGFTILRTTA
jgi:hypothetical protein